MGILCFITIIIISSSILMIRRKTDYIKCVTFALIYYFMTYVLVSAGLFWIKRYTIERAVCAVLAVWLGITLFAWLRGRTREKIQWESKVRESWLSYLLIILLVILFSSSFGFFGMGQDQGVYQTEAINLYQGNNDWRQNIEEYDQLPEGIYKEYYFEEVIKCKGYGITSCKTDNLTAMGLESEGGLDGIYHGIPSYPAILALSASIFGIEHMLIVQLVFYILLLLVMEMLLRELGLSRGVRALIVLLLGISPEVLWVRRSSLTEGFLAVLVLTYLYYCLHKEHKYRSLSVIPVIVFGFYHVTMFTMVPLFLINFWAMYLVTREKRFIRNAIEITIGYAAGFFMMAMVQPIYTLDNYYRAFRELIPMNYLPYFVAGMSGVAFLVSLMVYIWGENVLRSSEIHIEKVIKNLFFTFAMTIPGFTILWPLTRGYDLQQIALMTIVCHSVLTGFIAVPFILYCFIRKKYTVTFEIILTGNTFVWSILVYSMVFMRDIRYYYYFARYLMPFSSVILVLFALFVTKYIVTRKGRTAVMAMLTLGIIILLPYADLIRTNMDDTRLEWKNVSGVLENIKDNDVVIVDPDLMKTMYHILRSKGAAVYPVKEDFERTMDYIGADLENKNIYYLTDTSAVEDMWRLETVYANKNRYQEDDLSCTSNILGLSNNFFYQGENEIVLYHYITQTTDVVASDDLFGDGWSPVNAAGYRWMSSQEADIRCYLLPGNYCLVIEEGDVIPFSKINSGEINVSVYVNDQYVSELTFSKDNTNEKSCVYLAEEYLKEGSNTITFKCDDLWSPQEFGDSDVSKYGFSLGGYTIVDDFYSINSESSDFQNGWSDVNPSGYRWMNGKEAVVNCYLIQKNYDMTLALGDMVPFEKIGKEIFVNVYINDKLVDTINYSKNSYSADSTHIRIPAALVQNGLNRVRFETADLWSPADLGEDDDSNYAISIERIVFN